MGEKKRAREAAPAVTCCCKRARGPSVVLYTLPTCAFHVADRTDCRATGYFSTGGGAHPFGGQRAFVSVLLHRYVLQAFYEIVHCLCVHDNKNVAGIFVKAVVVAS